MDSLDTVLGENALLAAKELNQVLKAERDLGPERLKLDLKAIDQNQAHHATSNEGNGLRFAVARAIAEDRETLKKMVKAQALLPEK